MAQSPTTIRLPHITERPGGFGFFPTSDNISEQIPRFPTPVVWERELEYPVWSEAHWKEVILTGDPAQFELDVVEDIQQRLPTVDALGSAQFFRYQITQVLQNLENVDDVLRGRIERRLDRSRELAFSFALGLALEAADTGLVAGNEFAVPDAIAAVDDELLNLGIYGGTIHIPAYLASRVKAAIDSDQLTLNGSRLHFMPSSTMQTEKVYGAARVRYAGSANRITESQTLLSEADGLDGDSTLYEKNVTVARGSYEGLVAFDGPCVSATVPTLAELAPAA